MSQTRRVLSHTLIYALGLGASRGIGVFLVPLYSRVLVPPSEFAMWDLCTITVLFATAIVEIGMGSGLARFYIQSDSDKDRYNIARTALTVVLLAGLAVLAVVWPFRAWLALVLFGDAEQSGLVILVILIAWVTSIGNQPLALLRAREKSMHFSMLCILRAAVSVGAILVILYVYGATPASILAGDLIGLGVAAVVGLIMGGRFHVPGYARDAARKLFAFGVPVVPIGLATAVTLTSDRYFLRDTVGMDELAIYSLGFKVAMLMSLATQALQTAWAPTAFLVARETGAHAILAKTFRQLSIGLCVMALGLVAYAPELTALFAPRALYADSYKIVPWIAFAYVLQSVSIIVTSNLVIVNRTVLAMFVYIASAAIKLLLNVTLIPKYEIVGAAAATLIAYTAHILIAWLLTNYVYPVPYEKGRIASLTAVTAIAALLLVSASGLSPLAGIPLRTAVLCLAIAIMPFVGVLPFSEIRSIFSIAKGTAARFRKAQP
jgi:O-antigen/teichoic acid export membrane protein